MNINALYETAAHGDSHAEEELFQFLTVRFRVIANLKIGDPQSAEDIVQEALLTIVKEYKSIEFETSFAAWASKVLDNRVLSHFGGKRRRTEVSFENGLHHRGQNIDPNPEVNLKERLRKCLAKVRRKNNRYARILALHYQGYETAEICARLGVSTENLYMILSRARAMLKRCVDTGEI